MSNRFQRDTPRSLVRAKSGYIRGVSCLSGYIIDEETGRSLVFSVLVNDIPQHKIPIARVKSFHEAVVRVADGWLVENLALVAGADGGAEDLGG